MLSEKTFWMTDRLTNVYKHLENDRCDVWIVGIIVYKDSAAPEYDALNIVEKFLEKKLDFNKLFGFYKLVIHQKDNGKLWFWCDNSGSQRYYYSAEKAVFADTLPDCMDLTDGKLSLDYSAVYQYLSMGRACDDTTIVEGFSMSSFDSYYQYEDGIITQYSKNLSSFKELENSVDLGTVMDLLVKGIDRECISAVATGGTDSRCVIAHLDKLGVKPQLLITGRTDNPDIPVAKEIAAALNLPLYIYSPDEKSENWLQESFDFCNGVYDVVLSYRHFAKSKFSKENNFSYEFGGTGGEFYKNSFYHCFRFSFFKNAGTPQSIYQNTFGRYLGKRAWYGEKLVEAKSEVEAILKKITNSCQESGTLRYYNKVGFTKLTSGFCNITGNLTPYCIKIDPLMERSVVASVCSRNVVSLSMARWQRHEITDNCPKLADIRTDQGYSCSLKPFKLLGESFKRLKPYFALVTGVIKRKLFHTAKKAESLWTEDYDALINSEVLMRSLECCKKFGIISDDAQVKNISFDKIGFILTIGMTLEKYNNRFS